MNTVKRPQRRLDWKNLKQVLLFVLAAVVCVGLLRAVILATDKPTYRGTNRSAPRETGAPSSAKPSWNLSLPGEDGFWEYQKMMSSGRSKSDALKAGYQACQGLDFDVEGYYSGLMSFQDYSAREAQGLIVSSAAYLCVDNWQKVKTYAEKQTWHVTLPRE